MFPSSLSTADALSPLSRAGPLRDLVKVFAKWLKIYAGTSRQRSKAACTMLMLLGSIHRGCPSHESQAVRGFIFPSIFTTNALTSSPSFSSDPGRRSTDRRSTEGRANIQELKTACLVLNTADYCRTTAAQVRPGGLPRPFVTIGLMTRLSFSSSRR